LYFIQLLVTSRTQWLLYVPPALSLIWTLQFEHALYLFSQ